MNFLKKMAIKLFWPKIKKDILAYVNCREIQAKYVNIINKKVNIPKLTEESEARLFNDIYDATRISIVEIIENIDINKIS